MYYTAFGIITLCRWPSGDANKGHSACRPACMYSASVIRPVGILLKIRNVSDTSCREDQNTHFVFDNSFFKKIVPFMR